MGGVPEKKAEPGAASKEVRKVGFVLYIAEWSVCPSFYGHLGTGCTVVHPTGSVMEKEEGTERHFAP